MRWVAAVALLAIVAIAVLIFWPQSRVELSPDPTSPPHSEVLPPEPRLRTRKVEPPKGNAVIGQLPSQAFAPIPPPPTGPTFPSRSVAATRPLSLTPGTGSLGADGGVRFGITREGIRAAVKAGIPEIGDCYREWLKLQPELGGHLKVGFTIDTDDGVEGKVSQVSLGDAGLGHAAMEGCVLQVFEDLRFEAPLDGKITVSYPLTLSADGPDAG